MPDEDFDDQLLDEGPALPEDIDEEDLDLEADEIGEEDLDDDGDLDVVETDDSEVEGAESETDTLVGADEDEDYEDEDEENGDDVEASLDVILKSRLVVSGDDDDEDDEDEEEEEAEGDERGDTTTRVLPKQPGEFVCRSCFLVKHGNQLADKKKMLCRDCV